MNLPWPSANPTSFPPPSAPKKGRELKISETIQVSNNSSFVQKLR